MAMENMPASVALVRSVAVKLLRVVACRGGMLKARRCHNSVKANVDDKNY